MDITGIKIDDMHTYTDWGLNLLSMVIPMPSPKTNYIDLPGADGNIDLTQALTRHVTYSNREDVQFTFDAAGDYIDWHNLTSKIANYLHGKKRKVIIDGDPNYYYVGRLTLDSQKSNEILHQIIVTGVMEPYKYELLSSAEDWLWDSFSFTNGVIRNLKNLTVSGTLTVNVPGSAMWVVPTIISSAAMHVVFCGKTYNLVKGTNKLYDIYLGSGDNILIFSGNGIVTIDYRGGSL